MQGKGRRVFPLLQGYFTVFHVRTDESLMYQQSLATGEARTRQHVLGNTCQAQSVRRCCQAEQTSSISLSVRSGVFLMSRFLHSR